MKKLLKIYNHTDFGEADRLDRLYMYMMQPDDFALNESDFNRLSQIGRAWAISSEELSRISAIRKVMESEKVSMYVARNIVADAEELFAPMFKRSEEMTNVVLLEKLNKTVELAIKAEEFNAVSRMLKLIHDIGKEMKDDDDIIDRLQPWNITFTNNPDALIEDAEIV